MQHTLIQTSLISNTLIIIQNHIIKKTKKMSSKYPSLLIITIALLASLTILLSSMHISYTYQQKQQQQVTKNDHVMNRFQSRQYQQLFEKWMNEYGKRYEKIGQMAYRRGIWINNFQYVREHNQKYQRGIEMYQLQTNLFADLTSQQFSALYLMKDYNNTGLPECQKSPQPTPPLPEQLDWSAKGAVTSVKDQGQCGSCWAFSTTGALESLHFIKSKKLDSYSQQQLVDCSTQYGNHGCGGGYMQSGFHYVMDHGITSQDKYPYKAVNSNCKYTADMLQFQISACIAITPLKQKSLLQAIALQPTSIAIQANHLSFQLYKSGVYNGNCGTKLDHGVLAVGYGTIDGKNYYKVKNSWGSRWGSQGYIYIARNGDGKGKCGILMEPSIPVL